MNSFCLVYQTVLLTATYFIIRYQARKLCAKPMLRGDIVLPYIIAMLVFEVMCGENIDSCIYSGPKVKLAGNTLQTGKEDEQLGYQCAVLVLGEYNFFIISKNSSRL